MLYPTDGLEQTQHENPLGLPLFVYQNNGTYRILTDGYHLYKEWPNRKGIDPNPISEGKPGYVLKEISPVLQFVDDIKEQIKALVIDFIKAKPNCLLVDVVGYIEVKISRPASYLAIMLLEAYLKVAAAKGLIEFPKSDEDEDEDVKFKVLRDFIVNTPLEKLLTLLNS